MPEKPNEEDIKYFERRILGEKNVRPNCNYSFNGTTLIEAQDKIDELSQQLQASQKLSEERRLALERCDPLENVDWCHICKRWNIHGPNCDYVRLCKKEE